MEAPGTMVAVHRKIKRADRERRGIIEVPYDDATLLVVLGGVRFHLSGVKQNPRCSAGVGKSGSVAELALFRCYTQDR
jgi:hypothetical protein